MDIKQKQMLAQRVAQMKESATIKMAQMARDLRAEGHDVISLSLGEPDFDTPEHIKTAAKQALDEGFTKYTPVPGIPELKQAISDKFRRDNNLDYSPAQIVVSNGAKQSIANVCLSVLQEGDEALILAPYWVSYMPIIKLSEATPKLLLAGIDEDYKVSAAKIKAAITDKTKLIIFSSPCNPTGSVYSKKELQAIAEVLGEHKDIYIISDEIYEYINFTDEHVSIGTFDEVKDRTITVNGFSKGFAMTGWRLGYMGAPLEIAKACAKLQGQFTSGANAFSQKAAAHALNSSLEPTFKMKEVFLQRRDLIVNLLSQIEGLKVNMPEGAFYVFPDVSYFLGKKTPEGKVIENTSELCIYLLQSAHVAVVNGMAFGAPDCIRLSYAASNEELENAVARIKKALEALA